MNNQTAQDSKAYEPEVKKNKGISPLWILPIITLLLAGWLVAKAIHDSGQQVKIRFDNAQGLIAGRTTIRYQGLEVGMVRNIILSDNLDDIYVEADIYPEATPLLSQGARFWLVKPTASLSGISGLDALVSGNYIAILPSKKTTKPQYTFNALDKAPSDSHATRGLNINLKARNLGGINIGSKIVYKKIPIGEVYNYQLDENQKFVNIEATIDEQYRNLITKASRFWNVSGVGAHVGFNGVDVQMEGFSALINGAIAVDSPDKGDPVEENSSFRLYSNLKKAGRGIAIKIAVPDESKLSPNGSPIMYRGLEIGQLTNLALNHDREKIIASAAIQPAFSDLLTSGTKFILEEAKVSLTGVKNISNLIKGNYLTIVPGKGHQTRHFSAISQHEFNIQQARSLTVRLVSNNSFGLAAGTAINYKGINVGSVIKVGLNNTRTGKTPQHEVFMDLLIDNQYAHLVKSQSRFFVTGSATAELTEAGLSITVPPAAQLLTGSISFTSEGKNKTSKQYELFASQSLAELAKYNLSGAKTLQLITDVLPPISKGSPLLYRNLQVGSVLDYRLSDKGVIINVTIENQYKHLLTKDTVFWNHSGVEVEAALSGISITAAPLKSLINGGISFDNLPQVENKTGKSWKLYDSYKEAKNFGKEITLVAQHGASGITEGAAIKYQSIDVGEVTLVSPDFTSNKVTIRARIQPKYVNYIAVNGSQFWIAKPKMDKDGIKDITSIVSGYIYVKPGKGKPQRQFNLTSEPVLENATLFTLQSENRGSLKPGTPVLFRDIQIGEVTSVKLGELADRIISTIAIEPQYAYLLRQNSVFWNVSGVDVSIGLSGANIRAGTVDSLIKGGVTFATPEGKTLAPRAKAGQTFYLNPQAQDTWKSWRTAIPKP